MTEVIRTEVMEIKTQPSISILCHNVKNLYNRANFLYKKEQKKGNYISYFELDRLLKHEQCYIVLPAHTAQHTLKLLLRNWKAFYQARNEWKKYPKNFLGLPKPPMYKPSRGELVAIISNQQVRIRNGFLFLPKKVGFTMKTRLNSMDKVREVRIIPRGVGYSVEIVYMKFLPKQLQKKEKYKGALDLGLINLVTFVDNIGSRPIVIKDEGKGVKSITQYYLKSVKKLQGQYAQQQQSHLKKQNKLKFGSAYYSLKEKWRRKVKNYFHQLSRFMVNLWKNRELHTIYIGYNPLWKQQLRLRKKTTQLFVIIPFHKLISMLKYKANELGISIELIDESYTSKCSFLDNEPIEKHILYLGKRIKRGLFCSENGHLINADVNAAYNILLKSDPQALPKRCAGGVGGYVNYPHRVSFQTMNSKKMDV